MKNAFSEVSREDKESIIRDKYKGNRDVDITDDLKRLERGEPLAYVINWIPFLNLKIYLDSRPLIPRPETEWWTEELVQHMGSKATTVLDLCAGSGAIGLSLLKECPNANVSFGELKTEHTKLIEKNIKENNLDADRASIRAGDLFEPFENEKFAIIASNPPYIPDQRELGSDVVEFEPEEALFAGNDGLSIIRRIAEAAPTHLLPSGELWMECDIDNIEAAKDLLLEHGAARAEIRNDPYGRPRLLVGYYS